MWVVFCCVCVGCGCICVWLVVDLLLGWVFGVDVVG